MAILNHTTKISASKTIGEIQEILVAHGAKKIVCDYDATIPTTVTFSLLLNDQMIFYSLPANYNGVLKAMRRDPKVKRHFCKEEQALRVAWRIIKDWIEAQCAIIEAGLAEMAEIFLPYAVTKHGTRLYKEIQANSQLLLTQKL
jgi:hypothetical protein